MLAVTALSAPAWLVPFGPNTDDPVSVKARIEVDTQRSPTGRSTRRPQAYQLQFSITWTAKMRLADYASARAAAIACQDEPVLVPFWPAARATTAAALLTSGLTVAWTRHWATYAINPGSLAGYDFYAPLLYGRLKQPPRLAAKTSEHVLAEWSLDEDAPASVALIPPTESDITFPTLDGYYAAIFPFRPDPAADNSLTLPAYDVDRQKLGHGRQQSTVFYPQTPEDALQPTCKLRSSAEAASLLGWWFRRAGGADCFWLASMQAIGQLAGDLAAGAGTLPTVAPLNVHVGDTLALLTTGQAPELVRVGSIVAGVVGLAAATAAAHPKAWTILAPAILARHTDEELAIDFRRANEDWIADVQLAFREVAAEYAATDGETRGTTIGRLPAGAWLARIDLDYSGALQSWFLTDWETGGSDANGQTWEYRDAGFDKLIQSIDLEDDTLTFSIRWSPGCFLENWQPGMLAATGLLTILRAPVSSIGAIGVPAIIWSGSLSTPGREGPLYKVKVLGANALFSKKGPHQTMVKTCYKRFCGPRCGLAIADWKFNAVVAAIGDHTLTIGSISRANSGSLPAGFGFVDWFALGWVQWTDVAGHPLRAVILSSAALASGQIVLTVDRQLGWANGNAVVAAPTCDKKYWTCLNYDASRTSWPGSDPSDSSMLCRGKYNNFNEFGGFYAMPAISPNFVIPQQDTTPAKK
jgi:hypothetical protein